MDLFSRFKKDYFNYLISIILPALTAAISIPVFKHILGAGGYGKFSLWLNGILIVTAVLSGWIVQSILRFYPASENKYLFSRQALVLSFKVQLYFFIPAFLSAWFFSRDVPLSILCCLALIIISLQFTILPIIQSGFLSKKIISSETIRMLSYITIAITLLKLSGLDYLYSLFFSVILSYFFSFFYLIRQAKNFFANKYSLKKNLYLRKETFRSFYKYGAPLSLWLVFANSLSYVDKLFILNDFGGEVQGNYQAVFDLISKSIVLLISPIVTSIFPILTSAYNDRDNSKIRALLKQIILYEILALVLVSLGYWTFGAHIVSVILKTPDTFVFRGMGFIIIVGTFAWQIAVLVQKRFELKMKSMTLLKMIVIAFLAQILFYCVFWKSHNELIYPLGFLISSLVYLFLVSATEVLPQLKYFKSIKGSEI